MTQPPLAAFNVGTDVVAERDPGNGGSRTPATPSGTDLLGLSAVIAVSVVVPLIVGLVVDSRLHSSPLGLLVGLVAGIAAAAVTLVSSLRKYLR